MQHQVQSRLDELRNELNVGQRRTQDLERELARLRDTMLRISGAIQVLEELQAATAPTAATLANGRGGATRPKRRQALCCSVPEPPSSQMRSNGEDD